MTFEKEFELNRFCSHIDPVCVIVPKEDIVKYCLDKERVRKAIEKEADRHQSKDHYGTIAEKALMSVFMELGL